MWATVAASALPWAIRLIPATPLRAHPATNTQTTAGAADSDLTRLLGTPAPALLAETEDPNADRRFRLVGVISIRSTSTALEGLALIAVDGHAPSLFHVGTVVDGVHILQAVDPTSVRLGPRDGSSTTVLSLGSIVHTGTGTGTVSGASEDKTAPSRIVASMASRPGVVPPTAQQLFHERQQLQFDQEQMDNQTPVP